MPAFRTAIVRVTGVGFFDKVHCQSGVEQAELSRKFRGQCIRVTGAGFARRT